MNNAYEQWYKIRNLSAPKDPCEGLIELSFRSWIFRVTGRNGRNYVQIYFTYLAIQAKPVLGTWKNHIKTFWRRMYNYGIVHSTPLYNVFRIETFFKTVSNHEHIPRTNIFLFAKRCLSWNYYPNRQK